MSQSKKPPTKHLTGEFEAARAQLDRAAGDLDELTVARLRAGRKRAVAAGARRSDRPVWWLPVSAAAAAIVTVTIATQWWRAAPPAAMAVAGEDIELLATNEGPDFFDNIDFYRWLEDQRDSG